MRGTVVTDTFTRTLASGWGTPDVGPGSWSADAFGGTISGTDTSVNGSGGVHSVPVAAAFRLNYLPSFSQSVVDLAVTGSVAVVPAGGTIEIANIMTRATASGSCYLFRVQLEVGGAVTARIFAPGGTQLVTATVPGITYTAGLQLRVRAQSIGRIHRLKVWQAAVPEPAIWTLYTVDGTRTSAGYVGVRSGIGPGNTNTKPVVFSYDNFASVQVADPGVLPVPVTVLAAFGADLSKDPSSWTWTDITGDVRQANGERVTITQGRRDETSQTSPASCQFVLNNPPPGYPYSANNPLSTNYPTVKRNTPIWVIVDPATRFFGYANGFPPGWDTTGRQAIVTVSASGILRRLMQGKPPSESPLRRAIAAQPSLRAYWPMEDAVGSTSLASGIPGGAPMTALQMNLAADSTEPGSFPLPTFTASGTVYGQVSGSFAARWQVDWYYKIADPTPNEAKILTVYTMDASGGAPPATNYEVYVGGASPGVVTVRAINNNGAVVVNQVGAFGAGYFNTWVHARLMVRQSGPNIEWQLVLFPLAGSGNFITNTVTGAVAGIYGVGVQPNNLLSGMSIGHVAVFDNHNLGAADAAQNGFSGELVTARLTRLCADAGVPITIVGTSTTAMGPQPIDTLISLLRECETTEQGLLYDGFGPGLIFVTRNARYNQATALTADMTAGQVAPPFAPADDDQRLRNRYTVSRRGGSSAAYEDSTGPLGTDPLTGVGTYHSSLTVNTATDDVLGGYASWLVHQGTTPGFRYPSLGLDLVRHPELIDDWAGARPLSRIDVANAAGVASGHTPGTVSLIEEGYTETLGPKTWRVTANCSPELPWRVAVVGQARVDGSGYQLAAGVSATATTLQVASTTGRLWGTTGDPQSSFPFDLDVAGIRIRVTGITGATSPQTFTVVRSMDGFDKPLPAGSAVRLWMPPAIAL